MTMTYDGNSNQRTGFTQPIYYVDGAEEFIKIPNLNNVRFATGIFSGIPSPFTLLLILRPKIGAAFESILKPSANGGFNVKDQNRTEFRFDRNTLTNANTTNVVAAGFGYNRVHSLLVRYEAGNESFILNGAEVYETGTVTDVDLAQMVYGTNTNVLAHDCFGIALKHGSFTAQEESEIDALIQAAFTIDTANANYASTETLTIQWNSTSKYWFLSINGSTEWTAPSGSTYQWIQAGSGGSISFSAQTFITEALYSTGSPGDATTNRLIRGDYDLLFPNNNGTDLVWVTCSILLGGNVRRQVEGQFKRDNIA